MKSYYYHNGQDKVGPLSLEDLKKQNITRDTYVWYEGLTDWKRAGDIPELQALFPAGGAAPQQQYGQAAQPAYGYQQPAQAAQQGYQQGYQQQYTQPRSYATTAASTTAGPMKMGALKAFSIIGLIFSLILFIIGVGVFNISGYCYDYYDSCSCYTGNDEQEVYGSIIIVMSLIFLTQSIITAAKSFKNYGT